MEPNCEVAFRHTRMAYTQSHANAPFSATYGARSREKMPHLTWVERENGESREGNKNMKLRIVGWRQTFKGKFWRHTEGEAGAQSWHPKRCKERLEIRLKRRKIKQTSKRKREPRTGSEEGEIECSLFEWLSDLSL